MKAKRFLSVLLALVLCFSLFAISASADITNTTTGTYRLHLTLYSGTTAQQVTNSTVTGKQDTTVTGTPIADYAFAIYAVDNTETSTTPTATAKPVAVGKTGAKDDVIWATNNKGRYLVVPATEGNVELTDGTTVTVPAQPTQVTGIPVSFLVDLPRTDPENRTETTMMNDVYTYPKVVVDSGTPTVSKQVAKGTAGTFGQLANIFSANNEVATWKVTVQVPEAVTSYQKFELTDTMDKRLSDISAITVKTKNGATLLAEDTDYSKSDLKTLTNCKKFVITFTPTGIAKLGTNVTVEYTTKIDTTNAAVLYGKDDGKLGNHVILSYADYTGTPGTADNTPDKSSDDPTPTTPGDPSTTPDPSTDTWDPTPNPGDTTNSDDPYVYTGKIDIIKVGSDATTVGLKGAEFTLTNGTFTASATTGDDGKFVFKGLENGTYTLKETKAPVGYELNITPKTITIEDGVVKTVDAAAVTDIVVKFVNIPKTDLPLTGGMGVTLFAVLGISLAAAGVFLLKSKRYE